MAKSESLMGEVATDWMDTECPEAKRLKVVPLSLIPALRVLGGGPDGQGESQGDQAMVFPYHRPGPGSESRNRRELAPEVIGCVLHWRSLGGP